MTKLIYIEIKDFDKLKYEEILTSFSEKVQQQILKFKRWESGYIRLLSKLLLLKGMQRFNRAEFSIDLIQYDKYNRPFFDENINFNISHTSKCAVCIISDSLKAGIDIEEIKITNLHDFKEVFDANEWKSITESKESGTIFYNYWTRKEAVIKADGRGMNIPLASINVQDSHVNLGGTEWYLKEIKLPISGNYIVHAATDKLLEDDELEIIRLTDY